MFGKHWPKNEEEVLGKYKVEDGKRGAYRRRGEAFAVEDDPESQGKISLENGANIVGQDCRGSGV